MDEHEGYLNPIGPRHYAAIYFYGGNLSVHAGQAPEKDLRPFITRLAVRYRIPFDVARRLTDDCPTKLRKIAPNSFGEDIIRVPLGVACARGPSTPDGEEYLTIIACECEYGDVPHYSDDPTEGEDPDRAAALLRTLRPVGAKAARRGTLHALPVRPVKN